MSSVHFYDFYYNTRSLLQYVVVTRSTQIHEKAWSGICGVYETKRAMAV